MTAITAITTCGMIAKTAPTGAIGWNGIALMLYTGISAARSSAAIGPGVTRIPITARQQFAETPRAAAGEAGRATEGVDDALVALTAHLILQESQPRNTRKALSLCSSGLRF